MWPVSDLHIEKLELGLTPVLFFQRVANTSLPLVARRRQRCTNSIAKRRPEIAFVVEIHAYFFFFFT